jgi:hypothetical protein
MALLGYALVLIGVLLFYSGITGQSPVPAVQHVLSKPAATKASS